MSIFAEVGETNFQGLNLILRLVGEEMLASEPLVAMESQVGDAAANMITPTAENPPVFLIPGVEGMASVFENLAKKLEYPTICLQFPYNDLANENMQKIANTMLPVSINREKIPNLYESKFLKKKFLFQES